MTIDIKRNADSTVIEIVGRLDTITASALDKTINNDLGDITNLTLNLKGLEYISSAGIRVLVATQKKMQALGSMKVTNVRAAVMEVFEMIGFADTLTFA